MFDSLILIICIFLLAGTIKGVVGIGLPTASISLLTQLDAISQPQMAIALIIFPTMLSNLWQVYRTGEVVRTAKRFWPFLLIMLVILWFFARLSASIPEVYFLMILGTAIAVFALSSLFIHPPKLPERFDRPVQIMSGGLAGVMGGLTGIWSPPMVIYFLSIRLEKDDFVRASGFIIFFGTLPLFLGYWQNGLMTGPLALTSFGMTIPVIAGFTLGEVIRKKLDGARFQKVLLIIFLLMGLNLIRKAIML